MLVGFIPNEWQWAGFLLGACIAGGIDEQSYGFENSEVVKIYGHDPGQPILRHIGFEKVE